MNEYKIVPGGITAVQGFLAAGVHGGLKKAKKDVALIAATVPAVAAGVFTTNKVKAAPLKLDEKHLQESQYIKGVVINSGNANACTGEQGVKDAYAMAQLTAAELNCQPEEILVSSTGVIGVDLPMDKVENGIKLASKELTAAGGAAAAEAIMTTDLFSKEYSFEFMVDEFKVTIGGMAKGSGMIHPNMATMLGFITTDLAISKEVLHAALKIATEKTFNMITVDGDTSTNDMVVALANGLAGNKTIQSQEDPNFTVFLNALVEMSTYLAKQIVKDGEGATKLVTVEVINAETEKDAIIGAKSICTSNLVKTALFGEDANWGRILAAVGYSGANFDPEVVDIYLQSSAGEEQVGKAGRGANFSEDKAKKILEEKEVTILVDLKQGTAKATAWTCDFSYDYVKINASYRS